MAKKVIVLLADGCEEVETVTPVTYLRRAEVEVTTASVAGGLSVKGARGVQLGADVMLNDLNPNPADWDAVVVPGGLNGANNIAAHERACAFLKDMAGAGKLVCAICASPALVLAPLGLLKGKKFTCFPGMEEKVSGAEWTDDRVVTDANILTSRAAGTAGEFAIAIIDYLHSVELGNKVADSVLL